MGYYIEVPQNKQKARQMVDLHNAKIALHKEHNFDGPDALLCVVENGPFDAIAVAYDKEEMESFDHDDGRPKTWLTIPKAKAMELCPELAHVWTKK